MVVEIIRGLVRENERVLVEVYSETGYDFDVAARVYRGINRPVVTELDVAISKYRRAHDC